MRKSIKLFLCSVLAATSLFTLQVGKSEAAATTFTDVGANNRAKAEIEYLAEGKIVLGSNGLFKPNSNITRAEFTMMLGRALGLEDTPKKTKFNDVGIKMTGSGLIQSAVDKGIITGYKDGTFKPKDNITRGDMAIIVSRAFGYSSNNTQTGAATELLNRGIDARQSDGSFAIGRAGTREEMALFLARAINSELRLKTATIPTTFSAIRYVNTASNDPLNLRKGPLSEYGAIGELNRGTTVTVGYTVGDWSYVKTQSGTVGFVSSAYLSTSASATPPTGSSTTDLKPLSDLRLTIDAGHGGKDPGAEGNGLIEKYINLAVVLQMKKILDETPIKVFYPRITDVFVEIDDRAKMANDFDSDAFVSVHSNKFEESEANGSETLYRPAKASMSASERSAESKKLGGFIQKRLVTAWNTKDRPQKPRTDLGVLNGTHMPATIVEMGFLTNKEDAAKLNSDAYQQSAAKAIYNGILDYFETKGYDVDPWYR